MAPGLPNRFSLTAALSVLLLSFCHALDHLNFGTFGSSATLSIVQQLGLWEANGLNVTVLTIPNSTYGYQQLLTDKYDILTGTIDNAVGLYFNNGSKLTILGQLDSGSGLVLATIPNITNPLQLRGTALTVDSPTSGYAYALRRVLSLYGLRLENGDYTFEVIGASRLQPLVTGTIPSGERDYGTILNGANTAQLIQYPPGVRPNIVANISDFIWPYAATSFTVHTPVLANATKVALLTRFLTAFYQASLYISDPANKNCSIAAIANRLNVSMQVAEADYVIATSPVNGETQGIEGNNFTVNRQGLLNVIDLRQQFGGFASAVGSVDLADAILPGTGKFIDYEIRDAAVKAAAKSSCRPRCTY